MLVVDENPGEMPCQAFPSVCNGVLPQKHSGGSGRMPAKKYQSLYTFTLATLKAVKAANKINDHDRLIYRQLHGQLSEGCARGGSPLGIQ